MKENPYLLHTHTHPLHTRSHLYNHADTQTCKHFDIEFNSIYTPLSICSSLPRCTHFLHEIYCFIAIIK